MIQLNVRLICLNHTFVAMKTLTDNNIIIRPATMADYLHAAPLLVQAMEDFACTFIQEKDSSLAIPLFEHFFQKPGNQYSYENTLVCEINHHLVGTITAYDGAYLKQLRTPFLEYLADKYPLNNFQPEDETEAGEFYIDTLSVSPHFQGKGIGSQLIQATIEKASRLNHKKVGLLVDLENPLAKKLYERLGFKSKGLKTLMGGKYEHMQLSLSAV